MSNNKIKANEELFKPIIKEIELEGSQYRCFPDHCIYFEENISEEENISDSNIFKKLKIIECGHIFYGYEFAYLSYDNSLYLAVTNISFDSIEISQDLINFHSENNSAFFLLLASKKIISVKNEKLTYFFDERLYMNKEYAIQKDNFEYISTSKDQKIRVHKLYDIVSFFDEFTIFKIPNDSNFNDKNGIYGAILYLISLQKDILIWLPYEEKTIKAFQDIAVSGNKRLPYSFIMESLTSLRWKYAFKDLYRCVENLYGIAEIAKFTEKNSCKVFDLIEFRKDLVEILFWRTTDLNNLEAILQDIPIDIINSFLNSNILNTDNDSESKKSRSEFNIEIKFLEDAKNNKNNLEQDKLINDKQVRFVAKKLYKLRNSYVHFRNDLIEKDNFNDSDWNLLILSMLNLISESYNKYYNTIK